VAALFPLHPQDEYLPGKSPSLTSGLLFFLPASECPSYGGYKTLLGGLGGMQGSLCIRVSSQEPGLSQWDPTPPGRRRGVLLTSSPSLIEPAPSRKAEESV